VQVTVPGSLGGERIDRAVALLTGLSRREINVLIEAGAVLAGGRTIASRSRRLVAGEVLEVEVPTPADRSLVADASIEVPVVFEDEHVLVVDKPAGLVVHPGAGNQGGTMVHGLLARTELAFGALVGQLAARTVERRYRALVHGRVAAPAGLVDGPIGRDPRDPTRHAVATGGKEARTRYEVLERDEATTLLTCRLETGRTHQIRVHLSAIGHPIVGDVPYGGHLELGLTRPYLHAFRLAFDHPATGKRVAFESPVPPDLVEADARR